MAGKIFVNYRRSDDAGFTQALYQRLEHEFTEADLFMDVEGHIKPGDDFVEVLRRQVAACDVMLAVIGPRWVELMQAHAIEAQDFVAIEINAALEQGKRVIPVLVGGAGVPRAETLPEAIRPLVRRNAVGLRPDRFKADCQGLITALKESLAAAEQERAARTDAERSAVQAARRENEEAVLSRGLKVEEQVRAQSSSGLSAAEVRKAEELANWQFVEARQDIADIRDHLARFPGGVTERYALAKLDGLIWAGLGATPSPEGLRAYLDEFPKGSQAKAAQERLEHIRVEANAAREAEQRRLRETEAWSGIASSTDRRTLEEFLRQWPDGQYADAARRRIAELVRLRLQNRRVLAAIGASVVVTAGGAALGWSKKDLLREQYEWRYVMKGTSLAGAAERALSPLEQFRECVEGCPTMVVVPSGEADIGTAQPSTSLYEFRRHKVSIQKPFAVGKFEITFAEWDHCVAAGSCPRPADNGWGRETRPVINVGWDDARRYTNWLSRMTGKHYRLLSEAEWEYAARARVQTRYPKGDNPVLLGDYAWFSFNSDLKTHPVGEKMPNAFGLYDMLGNIREWTEDAWHEAEQGAPQDGSAWTEGGVGDEKVARGGSFDSNENFIRFTVRSRVNKSVQGIVIGFRVARKIEQ